VICRSKKTAAGCELVRLGPKTFAHGLKAVSLQPVLWREEDRNKTSKDNGMEREGRSYT